MAHVTTDECANCRTDCCANCRTNLGTDYCAMICADSNVGGNTHSIVQKCSYQCSLEFAVKCVCCFQRWRPICLIRFWIELVYKKNITVYQYKCHLCTCILPFVRAFSKDSQTKNRWHFGGQIGSGASRSSRKRENEKKRKKKRKK